MEQGTGAIGVVRQILPSTGAERSRRQERFAFGQVGRQSRQLELTAFR